MKVDIHASVLDADAMSLLRRIGEDTALGSRFYLAGGTALALQIGHRVSRDLDFFTTNPADHLSPADQRAVASIQGRVTLRERGQIDLEAQGTKLSFVAYPFAPVHELGGSGPNKLATPAEIALMKAYSLGRRITARDYVDLYFLLRDQHTTLDEIRTEGEHKFRLGDEQVFSYMGFLRLLVDSSDVDDWAEVLSLVRDKQVGRPEIDDFFLHLVQEGNGIE